MMGEKLFMFTSDRRVKVAFLSILSNTTLIIFKVIAGILSNSVSIISESIHSGMDLVASLVAFFSIKYSTKPADEEHPYGHGKIENISGMVEGLLIFIAAGMIITEAIKKIFEPGIIEEATIAIIVMFISALINLAVSRKLYKVSKEEDSMALEADALHLKTDVYTSLGVGIGIFLIKVTGLTILDSIVAILVALLIIKEAWALSKNAFNHIIDVRLSREEEEEIEKVIRQHKHQFVGYHKLKTRKSGNMKHVDFHIIVDYNLTVGEAHEIIGGIKKDMNEKFKNIRVNVHIDPYKKEKN